MHVEALSRASTRWSERIPEDQWTIYSPVIRAARRRQIPFALGGAFALATYTGRWRNTKDLDLYVRPRDRETMKTVLSLNAFRDYYEELPYDRTWIYRGERDGVIVDVIWSMANHRADVDIRWVTGGPEFNLRGEPVRALPAEELLWAKLYVLQRDRTDWPDLMNILASAGERMDWRHLLRRLGDDRPLLGAVLQVYAWLCPGPAERLPGWLWEETGLMLPADPSPECVPARADLLDRRPWFGPIRERRERGRGNEEDESR